MAKKDGVPADDLLKQLEEAEREARRKFEEDQRENRMKRLGAIIEPLQKERNKKAQMVNDLNTEILQLDKEMAKLKGVPMRATKAKGSGTRTRLTKVQKEQLEQQALAYLGKNSKGVSRSATAEHLGIEPTQAAGILRGLFEAKKIKKIGDKANTLWQAA